MFGHEHRPDIRFTLKELDFPDRFNLTEDLLDRHLEAGLGDKAAVRFGQIPATYQDFYRDACRLANGLRWLGISPGDRVMIRIGNQPEFHVAALAIHRLGAVVIPTMSLLREGTLTQIAGQGGPKAVLVTADLLDEVEKGLPKWSSVEQVIVFGEPSPARPPYVSARELMEAQSPECSPVRIGRDDLSILMFTSGTTGEPKGCAHQATAPLAVVQCTTIAMGGVRTGDVWGGTPPLAFTFGYLHHFIIPFFHGNTVSLIPGRATPESAWAAIKDQGITIFNSVPTMYNLMLRVPEVWPGNVRCWISGGAPLLPALFDGWKARFGSEIINVIGSHELLGSFVWTWKSPIKPGSSGYPIPGYEACILDPDGNPLPPGEQGLLGIRGPTGTWYWQPEKQRTAVLKGWSLTGDVAYQDSDGCIWIVSRSDDVIKSRAYRISPEAVENCLMEYPGVLEAAVVGVPDEIQGQRVKAYLVLSQDVQGGADLAQGLRDFCRERIAPYMVPSEIEFLPALPKTETGKIRRVTLRELHQSS